MLFRSSLPDPAPAPPLLLTLPHLATSLHHSTTRSKGEKKGSRVKGRSGVPGRSRVSPRPGRRPFLPARPPPRRPSAVAGDQAAARCLSGAAPPAAAGSAPSLARRTRPIFACWFFSAAGDPCRLASASSAHPSVNTSQPPPRFVSRPLRVLSCAWHLGTRFGLCCC